MNANETPEAPRDDDDRTALIARRAYERWQARGCPVGDDRRDWFEAEAEIAAERTAHVSGTDRRSTGKRSGKS